MRRDVFQAIADPNRRAIMDMLAQQPLHLNAIAEHFDISRPAISKHLKILKECELVAIRKEGRESYYSIQPQKLKAVAEWVDQYTRFWEEKLDAFEQYLDQLQSKTQDNDEYNE